MTYVSFKVRILDLSIALLRIDLPEIFIYVII